MLRKIDEKKTDNLYETSQTYETSDLFLATYLKTQSFDLENIYRDGRRAVFVFRDKPDRKELINLYFNGAQVKAIEFVHNLDTIKTALFNC